MTFFAVILPTLVGVAVATAAWFINYRQYAKKRAKLRDALQASLPRPGGIVRPGGVILHPGEHIVRADRLRMMLDWQRSPVRTCVDCRTEGFLDTLGRCEWCAELYSLRRVGSQNAEWPRPSRGGSGRIG